VGSCWANLFWSSSMPSFLLVRSHIFGLPVFQHITTLKKTIKYFSAVCDRRLGTGNYYDTSICGYGKFFWFWFCTFQYTSEYVSIVPLSAGLAYLQYSFTPIVESNFFILLLSFLGLASAA
jgi:hypothetical protein